MNKDLPHVVIIGAGFGGLTTAQALKRAPVQITVVDRTNHHLFQPLLYQVAMAGLSPADIAAPIRSILRKQKNVTVLLDEATDVNLDEQTVNLRDSELKYDYLVLATGGHTSYFGHDEWEKVAPGLKDLDDAVEIRRRVLLAFEAAEKETDPERHRELLTFVVVGGGPLESNWPEQSPNSRDLCWRAISATSVLKRLKFCCWKPGRGYCRVSRPTFQKAPNAS